MALRVMWPEWHPEEAVKTANVFKDWWLSFRWGLRSCRTCRVTGGITAATNAVGLARECDRLPDAPRPWHPDCARVANFYEFEGQPAMDDIRAMVDKGLV